MVLDKQTEAKLIAIGNKRYYRVLALTIAWIVIVVASWLTFMFLNSPSFAQPVNYAPLILCTAPFFPFFAHKTLFSKTFYATVDHKVDYTQFQQLKEAYVHNRPNTKEAMSVKFKKDNGKRFERIYKKTSYIMEGIHYDNGDQVLFVRGLKYPVKIPITDTVERTCPVCGRTVGINDWICKRCNFDYSKLLK